MQIISTRNSACFFRCSLLLCIPMVMSIHTSTYVYGQTDYKNPPWQIGGYLGVGWINGGISEESIEIDVHSGPSLSGGLFLIKYFAYNEPYGHIGIELGTDLSLSRRKIPDFENNYVSERIFRLLPILGIPFGQLPIGIKLGGGINYTYWSTNHWNEYNMHAEGRQGTTVFVEFRHASLNFRISKHLLKGQVARNESDPRFSDFKMKFQRMQTWISLTITL